MNARTLVALLTVAASSLAGAVTDVPFLSGRVVDHAEILSAPMRDKIAARLKEHEEKSTNQVVVLTVPTIGDESIEQYATRVFADWKLGRKGKDNGVLVIVAPKDRKMRIEVGYGLEGTLTDASSSRIIRNDMTPRFKSGDYDGGIDAGVSAIIARLEGGAEPADNVAAGSQVASGFMHVNEPELPPWPMRILLGAFVFGIIGLFTFIGLMTPGVGWFLYFFLIPFWAMFPIIILGVKGALIVLVIYVVGFPVIKLLLMNTPWYAKAKTEMKTKRRCNLDLM